jgi:hypothetical protein
VTPRLNFLGLLPALILLCGIASAEEGSALLPPIPPPAKGEECVEPTDVMRRDHMRFLMHQRDDTVHGGIRGARHSLVGCIECHAQTDAKGVAIAVNARGQFCESCHSFAGVRMDCFGCHAAVPAPDPAGVALPERITSPALAVTRLASPRID